jgi:hypothetical protein
MDGFVYRIGLFHFIARLLTRQWMFWSLVLAILFIFQKPITDGLRPVSKSHELALDFSNFSPAFAAFEDDFLFQGEQDIPTYDLEPGLEDIAKYFEDEETSIHIATEVTEEQKRADNEASPSGFLAQFDGDSSLLERAIERSKTLVARNQQKILKKEVLMDEEELRFGSLASLVTGNPTTTTQPTSSLARSVGSPVPKPAPQASQGADQVIDPKALEPDPVEPTSYKVTGNIQLKGGLAFLGPMDVHWVSGDMVHKQGTIYPQDALYQIEVEKMMGEILISLYDNKEYLIGEGFLDLSTARVIGNQIRGDIEIHPVDWDQAGEVFLAKSISDDKKEPARGVEIALYSFNDATTTNADGKFSFPNWKKTNSRTLAMASKNGYRDSIFMLDSRSPAQVYLFSESYLDSLFYYLRTALRFFSVKEKGLVYGKLEGVQDLTGYQVSLESAQPIYFETGLASVKVDSTQDNGLFAFVGLDDGDYTLIIEKDGEVVDERIVVVEQGKVSPVVVNLQKVMKHLEFFNPLNPDQPIKSLELNFFDGLVVQDLDQDNHMKTTLSLGSDPSLIEYSKDLSVKRTLVSRTKRMQRIPVIEEEILSQLLKTHGAKIEEGLILGFIDSEEPYTIEIVEERANKVIYFNREGKQIDPKIEVAFGFLVQGFAQGLNSLAIISVEDSVILGTDLIFSNHESISTTYLKILSELD